MRRSILLAAGVLLLPVASRANDSALAYGGSPKMLKGHPTVSMKSEHVRIEVGEENSVVDCKFVFVNNGSTCKVRMGFPDSGSGESDPDAEGQVNPPKGTFKSFQSWVAGKPVKTRVIRADTQGDFWHVKTVTFPANRTLVVRDRYVVEVGGSVGFDVPMSVQWTSYVLHTGSSWHGPIGRSVVDVTFKRKGVRTPIRAKRIRDTGPRPNYAENLKSDKRAVYYKGPGRPSVTGKTLRFVRTNWRPAKKDDIHLVFDMRRLVATR